MASYLQLCFPRERISAYAELFWKEAPHTCRSLVGILPLEGESHHAIYSGSECVLVLPKLLRIAPENATTAVTRGTVAFAWLAAGSFYGVHEDLAEICWFYDLDAKPRMSEGPVEVNVFARIVEPATEFYAVCRRMRREGVKPFTLSIAAIPS